MGEKDNHNEGKESAATKRDRKVPPPTRKGTFFKNLFLLSILGLVVIGLLAYLSFDSQDLSDIDGYVENSLAIAPAGPNLANLCLLYTSPSPRDRTRSRMPSSA